MFPGIPQLLIPYRGSKVGHSRSTRTRVEQVHAQGGRNSDSHITRPYLRPHS